MARELAPRLKPLGLTEKAEPQWLAQIVRGQIIPILSAMQSSTQTGGPDGRSLVDTAFEFQPTVGDVQKMTVLGNLVQMWQEARALGCFNAEHQFSGAITKGPDAGAQVVFEYIVPLEHAPKFSRDLSNVRLVPPAKSREKGGANAERDLAFGKQLLAVEREVVGMIALRKIENGPPPKKPEPTNNLGQTKEEQLRLFEAEMTLAGDAALKTPSIRLGGRLTEQPMKRNGYQWIYTAELTNLSPHPTEVAVEWWLIGDTEIKHLNYLMAEGEETLKLRSAGIERLEFKTKSKSHYDGRADDLDGLAAKDPMRGKTEPKYRGIVIRVIHGKDKKTVATWTSDATMARSLSDEPGEQYDLDRLPRLYESASK
ncbi:hypothetical protein [Prosthecobacter sp.]|uniref:hypothetical protein n=1 Tax=Prosthecobacter sp. TaxID=1965333 RepID=UPI002ABC38B4|nr:hypothetical protein [Prosthecobacter sp.]MDZ4403433.1 hypothetical protein [Prosthecobacter sp.]